MIAYVDGSYDPDVNVYGYSVVILDGYEVHKMCGAGDDQRVLPMRNVSGELIAAMCAVRYAISKGEKSIEIRYDYEGIEHWVTGAWKAKRELTAEYRAAMRKWMEEIDITFKKVVAHTGDEYNEVADALAKKAIEDFVGRCADADET